MHAYLIVGDDNETDRKISELFTNILPFEVKKIDEARELIRQLKYTSSKDEYFLIKNIDEATPEAINCLLKTIEEPNAGINFVLTSKSVHTVLPTIQSRCQVIFTQGEQFLHFHKEALQFLKGDINNKVEVINKLKSRIDTVLFLKDSIYIMKKKIESGKETLRLARVLKKTMETLKRVEANANPFIQLTSLAVNINEETIG